MITPKGCAMSTGVSVFCIWLLLGWLCPPPLLAQSFDLARLRRSVVRVMGNRGNSIGSGAIITVDGQTAYILTAHHVIAEDINQGRRLVQVELYPDMLRDARLSEQRSDRNNDIAVLIVENLPSPPPPAIPWGDSDAIQDTQRVFAIGHPRGVLHWAVTDGFISGLQAGKVYFSGTAVNRGNSGGPLLNDQGVLVGMNQQLVEGSLGIALMSNVIRPLLRGWVPGFDAPERKPIPDPAPQPPAPATTRRGQDGKDMLLVPEGWFEMGSTPEEVEAAYQLGKKYNADVQKSSYEDELSKHRVWLEAFSMDATEVTNREYRQFIGAGGYTQQTFWSPEGWQFLQKDKLTVPGFWTDTRFNQPEQPVVGVSWYEADAYCRWAGKQLPAEAQWEKAARGADRRQYPWGNAPVSGTLANYCDVQCDQAWKDTRGKDGYPDTAPVGSYPSGKSPYGIEDLAGNVWEWVQDWYAADYYRRSPERNPVNDTPAQYRVLRGGGWRAPPANVRTANRGYAPVDRDRDVGFRCVVRGAALSTPP